jgi:hypothetical protein
VYEIPWYANAITPNTTKINPNARFPFIDPSSK